MILGYHELSQRLSKPDLAVALHSTNEPVALPAASQAPAAPPVAPIASTANPVVPLPSPAVAPNSIRP